MHARPIQIGVVCLLLMFPIGASASLAPQQASFVPWKVLERGQQPPQAPLILYWLPASAEELKRSELVISERLTGYAGRCVAMNVVRADDEEAVARIGAGHDLPAAVLMSGGGEIGRVENQQGRLSLTAVESMVRGAFDTREAAVDAALAEAKKRVAAREVSEAVALYRSVAAERCMFPRQAKTAARALKRLGAAE